MVDIPLKDSRQDRFMPCCKCGHKIYLGDNPSIKDQITCSACGREHEIVEWKQEGKSLKYTVYA